ncbi:MAG: ribosome recycling factor [Bacteroidota bacterium]
MIAEELNFLLEEAEESMQKSMEHLGQELNTIRAGRATPAMLDNVRVDYYGSSTPITQVASVSAPSPDLLVIQPWDKSALSLIERAIMSANMGINPSNDGTLIRIPIPPLSEERRRELVKTARSRGEDAKIAIRNIRRSIRDQVKKTQKEESLSEDMRFEAEEKLQEMTDAFIERVDKALDRKEKDIMSV